MIAVVCWAEDAIAVFALEIFATIWVTGLFHEVFFVALDDPGLTTNLLD